MSSPKRVLLSQKNESPEKKSRSAPDFDWKTLCFICSGIKARDRTKGMKYATDMTYNNVKEVAKKRNDSQVLDRLQSVEENFRDIGAKYHKSCYKLYTSVNSVVAVTGKREAEPSNEKTLPSLCAAKAVLDMLREDLKSGKVFLLTNVTDKFKEEMHKISGNYADVTARTERVKKWMLSAGNGEISFHSLGNRRPDIMCRSGLSLGEILKQCMHMLNEDNLLYTSQTDENELSCLYRAAHILKRIINKIPTTESYPAPSQCDLEGSLNVVPKELAAFVKWIISAETESENIDLSPPLDDPQKLRRVLTISEAIIYSARRKSQNQVIPPFHLGLAIQLENEGGDSALISQLHAYGLCVSYDEVRKCMTALAEEELRGNTEYVPKPIVHRENGGSLLHEGDDNVDINTRTFSGKNTCHSMARAYFQIQTPVQAVPFIPLARAQRRSLDTSNSEYVKLYNVNKPAKRPEPPRFLEGWQTFGKLCSGIKPFYPKDLAWVLLRGTSRGLLTFLDNVPEEQVIPFWTGFNTRLAPVRKSKTVVCYAPPIDAKPADFSTCYTTLKKGKAVAEACGQPYSVHTGDQQIYAVFQDVKQAFPEEFEKTVLRLGGFHTMCTFIACIGKLWGDAGLLDMLVDSGVYAHNTAEQMLAGKDYYRAVEGLTMCYEALMHLFLENFQAWLMESKYELLDDLISKVTAAYEEYKNENWNGDQMKELLKFVEFTLMDWLDDFVALGKKSIPTFAFWFDCIYALQIMLCHLRAEREGNWTLHLSAQAAMMAHFFVCNRTNYARWSSLYVLQMANLDIPDLKEKFENGEHSVYFSSGAFRGLYSDIAVEMSVIKDTKSDSGISRFARKENTVLRWNVTRHVLGLYSRAMHERSGYDDPLTHIHDPNSHEQESRAIFQRENENVTKIISFIKSSMTDPFSAAGNTDTLIHIGSGLVATKEVQESLLNAISMGKNNLKKFVEDRLENLEGEKATSFHHQIKQSGLKTFANIQKPTVFSHHGNKIKKAVPADVVFQRALAVKRQRGPHFDLEEILNKPLTSVPPALFKADGSRRTTCKSDLMHALEDLINEPQTDNVLILNPSENGGTTIVLIDGMAALQKINTKSMTIFKDVAEFCWEGVLHKLQTADELHYVFDRYDADEINPKSLERRRRYGSGIHEYEIDAQRSLPNWDKVMGSDKNKASLTSFLSKYMEDKAKDGLPNGKRLVLGGGYRNRNMTKLIINGKSEIAPELCNNHTEADTRLIFHTVQLSKVQSGRYSIVVESPDTDVLILLVAHYRKLQNNPQLWFKTGSKSGSLDNRRVIPVHSLADVLEKKKQNFCTALLALHALTGCDTVSSLFYIGKKAALKALADYLSEEDLFYLSELGSCSPLSQIAATRFIACLYDPKGKFRQHHTSINILRMKMAMQRGSIDRLPPSEPALKQHIMRSSWQTHIWANAHKPDLLTKDPLECGWHMDGEDLQPVYFSGESSLETLQKIFCSCKRKNSCSTETCPCKEKNLECCDICSCGISCQNRNSGTEAVEEDDFSMQQ